MNNASAVQGRVGEVVASRPKARYWPQLTLLSLDTFAVFASFFGAYWFRNVLIEAWTGRTFPHAWTSNHVIFMLAFSGVTVLLFRYLELYKEYIYVSGVRQAMLLTKAVAIQGLLLIFLAFYGRVQLLLESRTLTTAFVGLLFFLLLVFRLFFFRRVRSAVFKSQKWVRKVLVVGDRRTASEVSTFIGNTFAKEKRLVGFISDDPGDAHSSHEGTPHVGRHEDLAPALEQTGAPEVFLSVPEFEPQAVIEMIDVCRQKNVELNLNSTNFGVVAEKIDATFFGAGQRFIPFLHNSTLGLERALKRLFDFFGALFLVIMLSPLLTLISLLIRRDSPGRAIFKQERAGLDGKTFEVMKFRTMATDTTDEAHRAAAKALAEGDTAFFEERGLKVEEMQNLKLADDVRVTKVGALLRKTSLDELPQLFNVLKGDMSLVGPRPLPTYELENFQAWHFHRQRVKPGITGLWQVTGRSEVTFDNMMFLDIYYALNWSLPLDLSILLRTLPAVVSGRGAN